MTSLCLDLSLWGPVSNLQMLQEVILKKHQHKKLPKHTLALFLNGTLVLM